MIYEPQVDRGRTAIHRHHCSRPVGLALAEGLISKATTLFDYGCGRGGDVRYLKKKKVQATGWDPNHRPDEPVEPADVVNLGYVLNVIEDPRERLRTLREAHKLARRLCIVSVRVDSELREAESCGDGVLTKTGTFQKIFTQTEFRAYLEEALGRRVHVAALGVAYVFKDSDLESRYVANRAFTRRLEYRADLIEEFNKNRTAKRFVKLATDLGRIPLAEEFKQYDKLVEEFGSPKRIERLTLRQIDRKAFDGSREQRKEDILTFLAMLTLDRLRAPKFSELLATVKADIRSIWSGYADAQKEARDFLFRIGQPDVVREACRATGVGKLLPKDFYLHQSAEDELPAILRLLLAAARQVVGDVDYNVVKIAVDGRSVSYLTYDNFDDDPHPRLLRSLRVHLPRANYRIRHYHAYDNPPILHRKDTLVSADYPHVDRFRQLTQEEESHELLSNAGIGFRVGWAALLQSKRLQIQNHHIVPVE